MSSTNTELQQAAEDSYANVLTNLKAAAITDTSNKENMAARPADTVDPEPVHKVSPDSPDNAEEEDNANFVPVVGHKKNQSRNQKRQGKPRDDDRTGESKATRRGKDSKRSTDRREKKEKAAKDKPAIDEQKRETADSSGSGSETKQEEPIKFVEAPLPKVNAWKVSTLHRRFFF